jgi:hypothetical protein
MNHLRGMRKEGLLSTSNEGRVPDNCPPILSPLPNELISVVAFHERGLRLLPHEFLHELLIYYGLESHHLTPSGVLHIVIPRSEKEGMKPPYVCPGCSNHTHGNNMINRCNIIIK